MEVPTEELSDAISQTLRIYQELSSDERRHNLSVTREPELGFATAAHQWTAGAPLTELVGRGSSAPRVAAQVRAQDPAREERTAHPLQVGAPADVPGHGR